MDKGGTEVNNSLGLTLTIIQLNLGPEVHKKENLSHTKRDIH